MDEKGRGHLDKVVRLAMKQRTQAAPLRYCTRSDEGTICEKGEGNQLIHTSIAYLRTEAQRAG